MVLFTHILVSTACLAIGVVFLWHGAYVIAAVAGLVFIHSWLMFAEYKKGK